MKENIYDLLNRVEMDLSEYETEELSSEEKEQYKTRVLMEVRKMKKNKKMVKPAKAAMGVAAACAVLVGAVGFSNTTLAENLFSHTFGKLIESVKGEKDSAEWEEKLTAIGKNASEVTGDGKYITTAEENGVAITISDVYCDGYMLYYTATLTTENQELKQADWIHAPAYGMNEEEYLELDGIRVGADTSASFRKAEDGTFVKMGQLSLLDLTDADGRLVDWEKKDSIEVSYHIRGLEGSLEDQWDESGEYAVSGSAEGTWDFCFPVSVDTSANKTISVNKEENGVVISKAVKTKAGLALEVQIPDLTKAPYYDSYNDPDLFVKDSEGKPLQWLTNRCVANEDGSVTQVLLLLYDGQTDLNLTLTNKNVDDSVIASIDFSLEK